MLHAVQVTGSCTYHGEGPFWDARTNKLLFVDMLAGDVIEFEPESGTMERHRVGEIAAVIRARASGGYVIAIERGFALADELFRVEALEPVFSDPAVRMNEGGCDPQGRFYCGSMAFSLAEGAGALYRLDIDHSIHTVLTGITISNGLVWSLDGTLAYYVDTATGRVDVFDFDPSAGTFSSRRPFIRVDERDGAPDGIALDEDGGLWVALWGGGAVRRYDPSGRLSEVVQLPVPKVTACRLTPANGGRLYITTSRDGLDTEKYPAAGALFAVDIGVVGAPVAAFAG